MNAFRALWTLLPRDLRRRFVGLQLLALVMAFSTVAGLVSIMPFLALLSDPGVFAASPRLQAAQAALGFSTPRSFLVAIGMVFVLTLFIANAVNYFGARSMYAFALRAADEIRVRLFGAYLRSDYLFHLRNDHARLGNDVLHESDRVAAVIHGGFQLLTAGAVVTLISVSILVMNPAISLGAIVVFGGSYALTYARSRRRLQRNGQELTRESARRATVVRQTFAAIKELLVSHRQEPFQRQFAEATGGVSRAIVRTHTIGMQPKYVFECLAALALVVTALLLTSVEQRMGSWMAQLTFLALCAYRLLPSLQQLFTGLVTVRAHAQVLFTLAQRLAEPATAGAAPARDEAAWRGMPRADIVFDRVSFRYADDSSLAVDQVSLRIRSGQTIGIAGPNGSGKSTLADLLLGLLTPTSGRILVDGADISGRNRIAWQSTAAYLPQHVALIDGTVAVNIALGVPTADIDTARLERAARLACVDEFVAPMEEGYQTRLGESGTQLSGGQRQRIGIARALYRDASMLVLDEATSSLDTVSEREITAALRQRPPGVTVVLIAHRRHALEDCDVIFEMHDGLIRASEPAACA
ncbi:MAG TPA: ABC transporter ATP-binding protein [Steroidobacteraceae bacterium]